MTTIKPFYIDKTSKITKQQVQDAFDKCVAMGVVAGEGYLGTETKFVYNNLMNGSFCYFGVSYEGEGLETVFYDTPKSFGDDAIEITLDQLDEHLGIKQEVKEEMTKYKTIEDFKNQIPEGATHYANGSKFLEFAFFKEEEGEVKYQVPSVSDTWHLIHHDNINEVPCIKEIKQEPKEPKFKYVQIQDSIFNLKPDFEAGELFCKTVCGKYLAIEKESSLLGEIYHENVYRRVERTEEEDLLDFLTDFEKEFIKLSDKCLKTALDKFRNAKLD